MTLKKNAFKNSVRKGKNAGNKHFLHFPQCFLLIQKRASVVKLHLFCHLQMLLVWTSLKICCLVKSKVITHILELAKIESNQTRFDMLLQGGLNKSSSK